MEEQKKNAPSDGQLGLAAEAIARSAIEVMGKAQNAGRCGAEDPEMWCEYLTAEQRIALASIAAMFSEWPKVAPLTVGVAVKLMERSFSEEGLIPPLASIEVVREQFYKLIVGLLCGIAPDAVRTIIVPPPTPGAQGEPGDEDHRR